MTLIEKVALAVPLDVAESENVCVPDADAEPEPERAGDCERGGLGDTDALADPVAMDALATPVTVGVPDADSDGDNDTVAVSVGVYEYVPVGVTVLVNKPVGERVSVALPVAVTVGVPLTDRVAVPKGGDAVAHADRVPVALGE